MQTDTLKILWKKETEKEITHMPPEMLRRMIELRWHDSRIRLIKRLSIELSMMVIVSLLVVWVTFFLVPEVSFFSMMFFGIACGVIVPSMAMFVFQIRKWRRLDHARDTRAHIGLTLEHHRRIVRFYLGLTYAFCIAMIALLSMWPFNEPVPALPFRLAFIAWCALGIVIAKPYARWMFGRDADKLEQLLHELETVDPSVNGEI